MKDEQTEITFTGTVFCFVVFSGLLLYPRVFMVDKVWENGTQSKWRVRNRKFFFAGFTSHRYIYHTSKYFTIF